MCRRHEKDLILFEKEGISSFVLPFVFHDPERKKSFPEFDPGEWHRVTTPHQRESFAATLPEVLLQQGRISECRNLAF